MPRLDEAQVYQFWDIFKPNNELVEVRLIGSGKTASGYFTNPQTMIEAIKPYTDNFNVYFTLNRINPACYGREQRDRILMRVKNTTNDAEIETREFVLVDLDAKRLSGVCSTKEEAMRAHEKGQQVYKFLIDNGFYEPIVVFSSSGIHLYLRCAMLNNEENTKLVKRFLNALSMLFSDEHVECDTSVYNAARISRLMGSYSCKGANNDPTRPQRKCRFLKVPDEIKVNQREYFEKIANLYPDEEVKPTKFNNYSTEKFSLEAFIAKHNIAIAKVQKVAGGIKYLLEECPWNSNHKAPDSMLFQRDDGAVSFFCYHNSDQDKHWADFRKLYEPDAYDKKREYAPHRAFKPLRGERPALELQEEEENKGGVWQTFSEIEDEDRSQIISIPSGITEYDKECCGFDKPSLNVWSGNNGSAKSTLLNQIAINAVNQGFKVAIYSGELRGQRIKRWIVMQAAGKAYNKKSIYNSYDYYTPDPVKNKVVSWLGDNLFIYNTKYSHNIEQVCLEVETLVKEKQIDMLIMDNLSCLDIAELEFSVNEQQKMAVKLLLRLTTKLGIATHLVVHPKKAEGFLRKNDVSGAKALTDLADSVFFCHRWNQDTQNAAKEFMPERQFYDLNNSGTTNVVECIKHREFGEAEGHIYRLYYEPESRRLKNSVAENIVYGWYETASQSTMISPNNDFAVSNNVWDSNPEDDDAPF